MMERNSMNDNKTSVELIDVQLKSIENAIALIREDLERIRGRCT